MKVMKDLSRLVVATEEYQRQRETSATSSPATSLPRWRARHQGPSDPEPDVAEDVRRHVAKKTRQVIVYTGATTAWETTSAEEEQPAPRCRKTLKSGLHRTRAITVLNKVTWSHEVVYTLVGTPAAYQDILYPSLFRDILLLWIVRSGLSGRRWFPI